MDIFATTSKTTWLKHLTQELEEICNSKVIVKALQTFMSMCNWEETKKNLEQSIIKTASFHLHSLMITLKTTSLVSGIQNCNQGYGFSSLPVNSILQGISEINLKKHRPKEWCRRRGYKRTLKSFDLSKIQAKTRNVKAISLKIRAKMAPNVVWLQKMEPTSAEKQTQTFLEVIPKKSS